MTVATPTKKVRSHGNLSKAATIQVCDIIMAGPLTPPVHLPPPINKGLSTKKALLNPYF